MRKRPINAEPGRPTRADIYRYAQLAETTINNIATRPVREILPTSVTQTAELLKNASPLPYVGIDLECIEQSIIHLTPQIVLVISEELYKHKIIRLPSDVFYSDWYYVPAIQGEPGSLLESEELSK